MTDHYKSHPSGIEAIEITQYESFLRGNILKYVLRAPYKGSEYEDLLKAAEYLNWEIERVEEENFLARERFKDLMSRKSVFVDADENAQRRLVELMKSREEWDSDENISYVADNWEYYRAGMTKPFDEVAFPDKCQECSGDCKVC